MPKKLWGGRFTKMTDALVENFSRSIDCDHRLAECDVIGSLIHISVLERSGFLSRKESADLRKALMKLLFRIKTGKLAFDKTAEDIHTNIQNELDAELGDVVLKLQTARSRNDQVLFDLKLYSKGEILRLLGLCKRLIDVLSQEGEKYKNLIIPGFTHMQHAQLVKLSDYYAAYAQMFLRDAMRLISVNDRLILSMGAGALAGTPISAKMYSDSLKMFFLKNKDIAKKYGVKSGFATPRTLDTVSDRDFVLELLSTLAIMGTHMSRISEELIIWSTREFGFLELDDAFATGSSLMPQKKNPDVLELMRGYAGTLNGNLVNVLTVVKGLPHSYNRDMQLDKPALFSSFEIVGMELDILPELIATAKWNKKKIEANVKGDESIYATDLAYYLISKGLPFNKAHEVIGRLVNYTHVNNVKISDISDLEFSSFSDKLDKGELVKLLAPEVSVNSRVSTECASIKSGEEYKILERYMKHA